MTVRLITRTAAEAHGVEGGVGRAFAWAASGEALAKGAAFGAGIVAARALGAADFGRFSFVLTVVSIALLIDDFGIGISSTRAIAHDPGHASAYVTVATKLGMALACLSYMCLASLALLGLLPAGTAAALMVFGVALFPTAITVADVSLLRGLGRVNLLYLAYSASSVLLLLGMLAAWLLGLSLEAIFAIYAASFLFRAVATRALVSSRVTPLRWQHDRRIQQQVLLAVPMTAVAYLMLGIYEHGDIVILGFLLSPSQVGAYAAAYRMIDGLLFLTAGAMVASLLPAFARLAKDSWEQVAVVYTGVIRAAAGLLLPSAALLAALAGPLVHLLYGSDLGGDAAELLQLLAPVQYLLALNFITFFLLFAVGATRQAAVATTAAAATNIALNLLLVPWVGVRGAVAATLGAALVMFGLMWVSLRRLRLDSASNSRILLGFAATVAAVAGIRFVNAPTAAETIAALIWTLLVSRLLGLLDLRVATHRFRALVR